MGAPATYNVEHFLGSITDERQGDAWDALASRLPWLTAFGG